VSTPQHICPKCRKPQGPDAFINEKGKPTKWCFWCRTSYRDKLTSLHQRDATKPKREEALVLATIARLEGYADHPLAHLLALSHIAGAKRALAIRDGKSWRGKKAWRAYYETKRALDTSLEAYGIERWRKVWGDLIALSRDPNPPRCQPVWGSCALPTGHIGPHAQRDPKSGDVS
jgi:hypothetical protein